MLYLFQRSSGKWYVKYQEKGNWVYRSLKTRDKDIAQRKLEALQQSKGYAPQATVSASFTTQLPQVPAPAKDMTFAQFWKQYLAWAKVNKRENSVHLDQVWFNVFTRNRKGTMGTVTVDHVDAFKAKLMKKGNKPQTINGALRALQSIWNKGIKKGWIDGPNPFSKVEKLAEVKTPPRFLSVEEIEKVIEAAKAYGDTKGHHEKAGRNLLLGIALAVYAGMRKNEVAHARWEWVDFQHKTVKVLNGSGFTTKTGEFRTIPLHPKLAEILLPYRKHSGFILETTTGEGKGRYRVDVRECWDTLCAELKIKCRFHDLRHTFASQLVIHDVSLIKVQRWLGHSRIQTTEIYAHLQDGFDPAIASF